MDETSQSLEAVGALKGQEVLVVPFIGEFKIHIEGYVDRSYFYVSGLLHKDAILSTPWFHHKYAETRFFLNKVICMRFGGANKLYFSKKVFYSIVILIIF